jgi:hypothetical protein
LYTYEFEEAQFACQRLKISKRWASRRQFFGRRKGKTQLAGAAVAVIPWMVVARKHVVIPDKRRAAQIRDPS